MLEVATIAGMLTMGRELGDEQAENGIYAPSILSRCSAPYTPLISFSCPMMTF